jgi:hypothetical protein
MSVSYLKRKMPTETSVLGDTKKKINVILGVLLKIKDDFTQEEIAAYNAKISAMNQDLDQLEYIVKDIYTSINMSRQH